MGLGLVRILWNVRVGSARQAPFPLPPAFALSFGAAGPGERAAAKFVRFSGRSGLPNLYRGFTGRARCEHDRFQNEGTCRLPKITKCYQRLPKTDFDQRLWCAGVSTPYPLGVPDPSSRPNPHKHW